MRVRRLQFSPGKRRSGREATRLRTKQAEMNENIGHRHRELFTAQRAAQRFFERARLTERIDAGELRIRERELTQHVIEVRDALVGDLHRAVEQAAKVLGALRSMNERWKKR